MILLKLRQMFAEDSREVREEKKTIAEIKRRISETGEDETRSWVTSPNPLYDRLKEQEILMKTDLANISVQEKALEKYVEELRLGLKDFSEKQYQVNELAREVEVLKKEYLFLVQKHKEAEIAEEVESKETASLQVIDWANIPTSPYLPKTKIFILGSIVVGIFLGIFSTFFFDYFDHTIRLEDDVELSVGHAVFAAIPHLKGSELFHLNGRRRLNKALPPLLWGVSGPELGPDSAVTSLDENSNRKP